MCNDGDCCRTAAKVIFIIVNLIFFLAGLLMLAFGIALVAAPGKVLSALSSLGADDFDQFKNASDGYVFDLVRAIGIFMIVLGGVVAIIACFGFVGACCESRCMLITYTVLLIIIVLAEVALIIFGAVFPDKFENTGKKAFYDSLKKEFTADFKVGAGGDFGSSEAPGKSEAVWNVIQGSLKCCGVYNYSDFQKYNWTRATCQDNGGNDCVPNAVVPLSCCILKPDAHKPPKQLSDYKDYQSCLSSANPDSTNRKGCGDEVKDLIKRYGKIAIGIAAGIVGLELIMITLAIILCCVHGDRSGKYV